MKTLFVFDIDGTLANGQRRFEEAGAEPSRDDRPAYLKWVSDVQNEKSLAADEVVSGMVEFVLATSVLGTDSIYLTSREEQWRPVTARWLIAKGFPTLPLILRPSNNWADGAEFKEIAIKTYLATNRCDSVVVVDDDEKGTIEEMCKRNEWTFLKARSGGQK